MNFQLYKGNKQTKEEINLIQYLDQLSGIQNSKKTTALLSTSSAHGMSNSNSSKVKETKVQPLTITQQIQLASSMKLGHIKSNKDMNMTKNSKPGSSGEIEVVKDLKKNVEIEVESGVDVIETTSIEPNSTQTVSPNLETKHTEDKRDAIAPAPAVADPTASSFSISDAPEEEKEVRGVDVEIETGRIAKKAKISLSSFARAPLQLPLTTTASAADTTATTDAPSATAKKMRINRLHELDPLHFPSLCMLMKESYITNRIAKIASTVIGGASTGADTNTPIAVVVPFKEYILDHFGMSTEKSNDIARNKQTLVIKLTTPTTSNRWSLNICPPSKKKNTTLSACRSTSYTNAVNWGEVLLHFNPRCSSKTLLLTDRCIMWSKNKRIFDAQQPECNWVDKLMPGETCELMIQVYPGGFAIFINSQFCCFYAHKYDIQSYATPQYYADSTDADADAVARLGLGREGVEPSVPAPRDPHLILQVNLVEEISDAVEQVAIHKIWWGHRDYIIDQYKIEPQLLEKCLLMPVEADVIEAHQYMLRSCIKVDGLPVVNKADDTKALEHLLYELYESIDYTVIEGVYVPKDRGCGYVRFPAGTDIQPAIAATDNQQILDEPTQKTCTLRVTSLLD